MNLDLEYFTLENGLRVVLHRDVSTPVVSLSIGYHVGSKDESAGKTGFAHLFEHLMFDGSVHIPRAMFDRYCEQAGGSNNAYTNEDKTCYYMVLPSHQLELGLWLESDRLLGLNLTAEGLDTQRSVVLEEKRQRSDNQPYGTYDEKMAELLFKDHPYGHSVIGSADDIRGASMADVIAFHDAYYRPDNAALVVAGDIDRDEARRMVDAYFGPIPAGGPPARPAMPGEAAHAEAREIIQDNVPLPAVFIGYRIPRESSDTFIAMDLVADILGNGESSRLHHALVYELQIANQASVIVDPRQHDGMLLVYAIANPGHTADELEDAIDSEIQKLLLAGLAPDELEKTRNRMESSYYIALQSMGMRADRLAHFALFYDDPWMLTGLMDRYLCVGADDMAMAASAFLRSSNRSVLHYLPR
jgi:zinc protease